jgi:hypothetical protein
MAEYIVIEDKVLHVIYTTNKNAPIAICYGGILFLGLR